jgi:hypothetical protein
MLEDGYWHYLTEITDRFHLSETETQTIVKYLNKFDLVFLDEKQEKIKINMSFLKLPV